MKKRIIGILAWMTAAVSVLTGCTGGNEVVNYEIQEETEWHLSFFGNKHEAENVEVIEDILTGYMEENRRVDITYESLKGAEYYDVLGSREHSGKLDDVFMTNHDVVLEFSRNGSLADLSDIVETIPFSESMLSQMTDADGKIYWVPTTVSAFGLYCNLDLLSGHGQKVPQTLSEWEAVCDYFLSQGITPIIANNDISLKTLILAEGFYPVYLEGRQTAVFDKLNSGEEALSACLMDGLQLAERFCEKGYIDASKALDTKKTSDDLAEFAKGEAPFMLTGAWAAGRVKAMDVDFSFEIVPYPILENGAVLVINPDVRLSVAAQGGNTDMAKAFVTYFLQEDNIRKFADNQASFSPLQGEFTPSHAELGPVVEYYQTQTAVIGSDSGIRFPIWDIMTEASRKLLSGEEVSAIADWMDEQARQN